MRSTFPKNRHGWQRVCRTSASCALVALTSLFAGVGASHIYAQGGSSETGITETSVAAYPARGLDVERAAQTLREQFAGRTDVKIVADPRTQRTVAQAPADVKRIVQAELGRREQTAPGSVAANGN